MPRRYDDQFYRPHRTQARVAAERVIAILREVGVGLDEGVLDIGCGRGDWLQAIAAAPASCGPFVGVDGPWNAGNLGDPIDFRPADLEDGAALRDVVRGERFGLAMSLETVEHLSPAAGDAVVDVLAAAAPIVLFSAAVPGQGGTGHRNEQWQSYWADRFADRGMAAFDLVRPRLWHDEAVPYWYRQNLLVFAAPGAIGGADPTTGPLDLVHPRLLEDRRAAPLPGDWATGTARVLRQQAARLIRRRA